MKLSLNGYYDAVLRSQENLPFRDAISAIHRLDCILLPPKDVRHVMTRHCQSYLDQNKEHIRSCRAPLQHKAPDLPD